MSFTHAEVADHYKLTKVGHKIRVSIRAKKTVDDVEFIDDVFYISAGQINNYITNEIEDHIKHAIEENMIFVTHMLVFKRQHFVSMEDKLVEISYTVIENNEIKKKVIENCLNLLGNISYE
jgi:uncharacterized protein (DUF1800 family)